MLIRLHLLLVMITVIAPLRAQVDGPVDMTPGFAFTVPLAQSGAQVTLKFPILVNPTTVLKPGVVLRVMYMLSSGETDDPDLGLAHKGNMAKSFSRDTQTTSETSAMPEEMAHEIEGYRRTVWTVPNNFILAMAQFPTDALHLMFTPSENDQDVQDTRFSFLEGLFVGLPEGKVTILGVEKETRAERAGLKAGDEILSVGGISTRNDLAGFASAYATAKQRAKDDEAATYPMLIRSPGQAEPHIVNIPMPPTLEGGLMHGI